MTFFTKIWIKSPVFFGKIALARSIDPSARVLITIFLVRGRTTRSLRFPRQHSLSHYERGMGLSCHSIPAIPVTNPPQEESTLQGEKSFPLSHYERGMGLSRHSIPAIPVTNPPQEESTLQGERSFPLSYYERGMGQLAHFISLVALRVIPLS